MASLPSMTRTVDDAFTETWYDIQAEAADNIMEASIVWLALKEHGSMVTQSGGEYITRTVRYALKSTQDIKKGSTLTQSEYQGRTMAWYDWAYWAVDVNRSMVDDQKNKGPYRIASYISDRLEAARDGAVQDLETKLFQWYNYTSSSTYQFLGLYDICPPDTALSGTTNDSTTYNAATTLGNITRSTNSWWQVKSQTAANYSLNLLPQWRNFYNDISLNMASPNFMVCNQTIYETYEEEVSERQQIVRTAFDRKAADLGFETLTFKGATVSWTSKIASTDYRTIFLNLDWIDLVYDPDVWFSMTEWKDAVNQLERVAYIVSALQLVTNQPRRHGAHRFTS
jgi:hypothetical protein